ncbi:MAG: nitroreductase [Deltaproteobacteria bacterium]|nr:nitroreductase [Deltaproteobacteria bacterium]
MDIREAILARRSIRQFLPKPVSEEMIRELLQDTLWSPSWGNTQPWEIVAASGDALSRFREENVEALRSGKPMQPEIPLPSKWSEALKDRYNDVTKGVYDALGIRRDDKEARFQHLVRIFGLFDAPALVIMVLDESLALEYSMLDIGIFLQTFCLLAHGKGLGTCILAASVLYAEIVRRHFQIPLEKRLVMGVVLGWPDLEAPVNRFERRRGNLEEFVRWV